MEFGYRNVQTVHQTTVGCVLVLLEQFEFLRRSSRHYFSLYNLEIMLNLQIQTKAIVRIYRVVRKFICNSTTKICVLSYTNKGCIKHHPCLSFCCCSVLVVCKTSSLSNVNLDQNSYLIARKIQANLEWQTKSLSPFSMQILNR